MFYLTPPRHISTLPRAAVADRRMAQPVCPQLRKYPCVPALTLRANKRHHNAFTPHTASFDNLVDGGE
jgi:hypothetical protein